MNVEQTKRTLKGLPPRKSVLLEARHGLGKSMIVCQTAQEMSLVLNKPFGFVDIRLSQREVGDLIGMPRGKDSFTVTRTVFDKGTRKNIEQLATNVTIHDLPHWFPTDPDSCGYLFLDELNRATREVQQAAFELVLDYRMNFHELPIGWRVISAVNEDQDVYSVLALDPALYDRFMIIPFKPTVPEWVEWAEKQGVHDAILKYISKFSSDLDTPEKIEPGKVYPSRRSWVQLSDVVRYMQDTNNDPFNDLDYMTLLVSGYVGTTIAINFVDYIRKDYKVFSAKDILDRFEKHEKEFKEMMVTDISFYNGEIIKYLKKEKVKQLNKRQSENLFKYYKAIPKEAAAGFWKQFNDELRDIAVAWYKSSSEIPTYTLSILGKNSAINS